MEKDITKILWKIEELWGKYYQSSTEKNPYNINHLLGNYQDNKSRYFSEFKFVKGVDFSPSESHVHEDDYGKYKGLKQSQLLVLDKKPVYLFDNHNKMIYPMVELFHLQKKSLNIVHIDAHPDDAIFLGSKKTTIPLADVQEYVQQTRISDFFDALSETSIIDTVFPVVHSDSFEFFIPPEESFVLSLDIDIFGLEGDFCSLEDKVRTIALAWSRADAICISTSPGFIDQEFAQKIIQIFVSSGFVGEY